jgi:hypothetical protein
LFSYRETLFDLFLSARLAHYIDPLGMAVYSPAARLSWSTPTSYQLAVPAMAVLLVTLSLLVALLATAPSTPVSSPMRGRAAVESRAGISVCFVLAVDRIVVKTTATSLTALPVVSGAAVASPTTAVVSSARGCAAAEAQVASAAYCFPAASATAFVAPLSVADLVVETTPSSI